ncbi:hypothetical protein ANTQUA_LOCUS8563 [Anthophora quadrimaculata]
MESRICIKHAAVQMVLESKIEGNRRKIWYVRTYFIRTTLLVLLQTEEGLVIAICRVARPKTHENCRFNEADEVKRQLHVGVRSGSVVAVVLQVERRRIWRTSRCGCETLKMVS